MRDSLQRQPRLFSAVRHLSYVRACAKTGLCRGNKGVMTPTCFLSHDNLTYEFYSTYFTSPLLPVVAGFRWCYFDCFVRTRVFDGRSPRRGRRAAPFANAPRRRKPRPPEVDAGKRRKRGSVLIQSLDVVSARSNSSNCLSISFASLNVYNLLVISLSSPCHLLVIANNRILNLHLPRV